MSKKTLIKLNARRVLAIATKAGIVQPGDYGERIDRLRTDLEIF